MFVTQHFTPRWKKEWIPLATQQLRLRNLIKILAFSIKNDKKGTVGSKISESTEENSMHYESYYFTLHATTMSAPFYTSEKLKTECPKWKDLEILSWEGNICNSMDAVVIRLWFSNPLEAEDKVLAVWGVYLSGLVYLGPNLRGNIPLKPNSIVFLMPGGYFTNPQCLQSVVKIRYSSVIVNCCDVRPSYTLSSLTRLKRLQQVIKKEVAEAEILKKKIAAGDFSKKTALRKLLSKHRPKTSQVDLIKVKESIEITKYHIKVLKEEKFVFLQKLNELNVKIKTLADSNNQLESKIVENYKVLKQEIYNHREWKKIYIDRREKYLHSKAMLNFRTKQLISELNLIYPIVEISSDKFTICGVHLPNSEDFSGHDDLQISIALGFVTHIIQMISVFLQIPLRYPVIHFGSRSKIIDQITDKIPDSEREFCLYMKGKEKLQFHYAVYLLNKNIAQMRWLCGLPTSDLRNTLENLASLIKMKFGNINLDPGKSLSSSTIDICCSNFSISSPIGCIPSLQPKKFSVPHHAPDIKSYTKNINTSTLYVPGNCIAKSVGSAKDLMTNALLNKNNNLIDDKEKISNNLSCSLDEGLNEYEESKNAHKNYSEHFGSEPALNNSSPVPKNLESKATSKFLKAWNSELQKDPFSDDDTYVHMVDLINEKENNVLSDVSKVKHEVKKSLSDEKLVSESSVNADSTELNQESQIPKVNNLKSNSKDGALDNVYSLNRDNIISNINEDQALKSINTVKCDSENMIVTADSLLENVTSRTEALVNQSTSFNRFKSRLKCTLESSN